MLFDQVNGTQRAKNNVFKDCLWMISSSEATASFIKVADTSAVVFSNTFINPIFNNALVASTSAAALNDAVTSVSSLVEGNLLFVNPSSNCSEFCSAVTDQVKVI